MRMNWCSLAAVWSRHRQIAVKWLFILALLNCNMFLRPNSLGKHYDFLRSPNFMLQYKRLKGEDFKWMKWRNLALPYKHIAFPIMCQKWKQKYKLICHEIFPFIIPSLVLFQPNKSYFLLSVRFIALLVTVSITMMDDLLFYISCTSIRLKSIFVFTACFLSPPQSLLPTAYAHGVILYARESFGGKAHI